MIPPQMIAAFDPVSFMPGNAMLFPMWFSSEP